MFVICDLCECQISTATEYDRHMNGRRHRQKLEFYYAKKELASRSLFVKGFPNQTSEDDLRMYFIAFGPILKIVYDPKASLKKKTPSFAIIEFQTAHSVEYALKYGNHILNSCRLEVRPRSFKELATEPHFPWEKPRAQESTPWNQAKGAQQVKPGRAKDSEGETVLPIEVSALEKALQDNGCVGIQTQMVMLVELVQVQSAELQQRYQICKVLEDALTPFFPGVTVNQFGSSVNGFGIKGCDMDVFVDMTKIGISCRSGSISLPYVRDCFSLKKKTGPLTQKDWDGMRQGDKMKLLNRILVEHAPAFKELTIIPSNRCPILRFTHEQTGLKCDLSINNKLALQNTRLLQTLSLFDARIRPLVYMIRYWAKLKGIAGNPTAGPKMSSYSLTMMIMYYLMNTDPPVLPSIEKLANLCGSDKTIIDQWDCSFVSAQFMPPTKNNRTAEELLYGFFEYYGKFDFKGEAISIRTGSKLAVTEAQLEKLLTKVGVLNVQDPFVLNHNITGNVNEKILKLFIKELRIAEAKSKNWFDVEYTEVKSISDILNNKVPEGVDLKFLTTNPKVPSLKPWEFAVDFDISKFNPHRLYEFESAGGTVQKGWCLNMIRFCYNIIERVLMFDCDLRETNMDQRPPNSRTYSVYRKFARKRPNRGDNQGEGQGRKKKRSRSSWSEQIESANMVEPEIVAIEDKAAEGDGTKKEDGEKDESKVKEEDKVTEKGKEEKKEATSSDNTEVQPGTSQEAMDTSEGGETENAEGGDTEKAEGATEEEQGELDPCEAPYDYGDSEYYIDLDVSVWCRIWAERKRISAELKYRGFQDSIELEQTITERLFYDVFGPAPYPLVEFRCIIKSVISEKSASIVIDCMPKPDQKEYNAVYHYMKKFVEKMVSKFFV